MDDMNREKELKNMKNDLKVFKRVLMEDKVLLAPRILRYQWGTALFTATAVGLFVGANSIDKKYENYVPENCNVKVTFDSNGNIEEQNIEGETSEANLLYLYSSWRKDNESYARDYNVYELKQLSENEVKTIYGLAKNNKLTNSDISGEPYITGKQVSEEMPLNMEPEVKGVLYYESSEKTYLVPNREKQEAYSKLSAAAGILLFVSSGIIIFQMMNFDEVKDLIREIERDKQYVNSIESNIKKLEYKKTIKEI